MAALLRHDGHVVRIARSAGDALDLALESTPDVVLLDIGLPGVSGYEVARTLRARPGGRELRIAAISGYGQTEDRRRANEAGCDVYFTKPVAMGALRAYLSGLPLRSL